MRSATHITVSTFGVIMALAGLEHGIGEVLQGNVVPDGVLILSWPEAEFFKTLAGEPAMTLVPNLLVSGILTIVCSLMCLVWATRFVQRRHGGLVLILLSILLLLVGGGFGPPLLGIVIGLTGTRINTAFKGWRRLLPVSVRHLMSRVWPWLLALGVGAWLGVLPGLNILGYFWGVDDANLTYAVIGTAFGSLLLTIVTGFGRDSLQPSRSL